MPRSPESTAREAIRARSTRKLAGQRDDADEAITGHSLFVDVRPAFELERIPEGGGYPVGLVELAARLMGVPPEALAQVVHLCSGSVRAARTFDLRPASSCAAIADVRRLPIPAGAVDWVMVDPPYGPDYAEALWGLGKQYPTPAVILRECERILRPGGTVAFLHHVVPQLPAGLQRIGTWGVTTGPNYRIRALTIAQRRDRGLDLGET